MSVSHWQRATKPSILHADLVIIGAGIAGLSAALHAQRRGLRVVVMEAGHVGAGASTRNAGYLMRGCADNYAAAIKQFGRAKARELWQLTQENLLGLMREGVLGLKGTRVVPSVIAALEGEERGQLLESVKLLREDGFDVEWIDGGTQHAFAGDAIWQSGTVVGALVNPHDAACNSHEVVSLLASRLVSPVLVHDEVFAIEASGKGVVVESRGHVVHARACLACTNAYGPRLMPTLTSVVVPNRGQMFACRPAGVVLAASYYLNHGHEYIRQAADGAILVGGCRAMFEAEERTTSEEPTAQVQAALEVFARRVLGVKSGESLQVAARWAGLMGFSVTGLPVVKRVGTELEAAAPVWFCGGFTGHGMSMAYETTRIAVGVMLDGAETPFGG